MADTVLDFTINNNNDTQYVTKTYTQYKNNKPYTYTKRYKVKKDKQKEIDKLLAKLNSLINA
jgi:hypothetical protein